MIGGTGERALFWAAARCVVDGETERLGQLLDLRPDLVRCRSDDAFEATLLHFVAANGVPDEFQRSPATAEAVCRLLLARGARPDALGGAYGGGPNSTPLCLLVSSGHPHARGVQAQLAKLLVEGGAAVDGRLGDGAPLATALTFGYTRTALALAAEGARVDNLPFAAGLGRLSEVRAFFRPDGTPRRGVRGSYVRVAGDGGASSSSPAETVQEALHLAVTHGQLDVAAFLVEHGADVDGRVTGHHCELPLAQAIFVGEAGAARWLLGHGADLDAVCGKRGESARAMARRSPNAELRGLG